MRAAGLDPALGGGNALLVADLSNDRLEIVDGRIDYGLNSTEEQLTIISQMAGRYRFSLLILEYDAQQKGLGNDDRLRALADIHGFTVRPHITRGEKSDPVFGVASMDQSFKKAEISIPYGDDPTRRRMDPFVSQLRAWRPDIPTKRLTQDGVMALWFVWKHWMQIRKTHEAPPATQTRPSWLARVPDPRYAKAG